VILARMPRDLASPERFVNIWGGLMDVDPTPMLPSVGVPTIIAGGALDAIIPPALVEGQAAGIPGARLLMLSTEGHNLYEGSAVYEAAVEEFAGA